MPDWISHIIIGLIFAEIFNIEKKGLVVLGSLLPDFVVKIYILSFFFHVNDNLLFVSKLYHAPIMGLIIPALLVPLFEYGWKKTYLYVMAGFMLHIFADSFTRHYSDGILLYPFSNSFFSFNVFWAEQYWIIMVASILAYLLIKLYKGNISLPIGR